MLGAEQNVTAGGLPLPLPAVLVEDGIVRSASASALRLGPHALIGEPLTSWFEPDEAPVVEAAFCPRGRWEPAVARLRGAEVWIELHTCGAGIDERQVVLLRDATDEQFLRAAVDAVADSTFVIGGDGRGRWRSAKLRRLSPQTDEEAARLPAGERLHPEDLPRVFEAFATVADDGHARVEARSRAVDDDDRWQRIELVAWNRSSDEVIRGYLVQVHNLDAEGSIETDLGDAQPGLLSLTEAAPVGIAVTDPTGRFVYRNPAARALLGPGITSLGDLDWLDLAHKDHRDDLAAAFDAAQRNGEDRTITAAFIGRDGPDADPTSEVWLRLRLEPQRTAAGGFKGLIVTIEDVSEQVATSAALASVEERMRYLATHDSLTRLPNRAALNDELERATVRHGRALTDLSVLFCDLDRFKPINDRLGHAGGDTVLVEVAKRLRHSVRAADFIARLGGDEFIVLCETNGDGPAVVADLTERIIRNVGDPIVVAGETVSVGVSIGVATAAAGGSADADDLLTGADEEMYRVKAGRRRGRDIRAEPA